MSNKTKIEWTEETWNPVSGCSKISPGCDNCYAAVMAKRLQGSALKGVDNGYINGFAPTLHPKHLMDPLTRKRATKFFVVSMGDLFHQGFSDAEIDEVFDVISKAKRHVFQVLTKRADRMATYFATRKVPANAWLGVTVENQSHGIPRIAHLRKISANVRFVSIEPLLEDLGNIDLVGINWVVVGGESGPKGRPMREAWVVSIKDKCEALQIPFFFKQWGTWGADGIKRKKKENGRLLMGQTWNGMPEINGIEN